MEKNAFLKQVSDADSETLLLSSQVMLNELARRYLESRQKDKESEQTGTQHAKHADALREIAADIESEVDLANERKEHASAVEMSKWARQLRALRKRCSQ